MREPLYPDLKFVKKILVIKLRHLGDVLLTAPFFSTLQRAFPGAKIDAYLYKDSIPMLDGHPAISSFISYDKEWKKLGVSRFKKEFALLKGIRKEGYDLVFNLTEGDRGVIAAFAANAKVRVGISPKGSLQKKVLTHTAKQAHSLRHTVEKNLDLLRRIGIFPKDHEKELFFSLPEKAVVEGPFVLIHPTSRWLFKCWPAEKMRLLAKTLIEKGEKVVLTGGTDPMELAMIEEIAKDLPVINLAGKVTLKQLGALIDASKLLICVDSVPLHLASALKKPVVALFGPTSEVTWGPWRNEGAKVLASPFSCRPCYQDGCGGSKKSDCLESLPFETVWKAVDQSLKSSPK